MVRGYCGGRKRFSVQLTNHTGQPKYIVLSRVFVHRPSSNRPDNGRPPPIHLSRPVASPCPPPSQQSKADRRPQPPGLAPAIRPLSKRREHSTSSIFSKFASDDNAGHVSQGAMTTTSDARCTLRRPGVERGRPPTSARRRVRRGRHRTPGRGRGRVRRTGAWAQRGPNDNYNNADDPDVDVTADLRDLTAPAAATSGSRGLCANAGASRGAATGRRTGRHRSPEAAA